MNQPRQQVSFENTAIAFSSKSNAQLLRSYYLFKLIANPQLVSFGDRITNLALKLNLPIGWALRNNIFSHFCGGEDIRTCERAIENLARFHIGTILDYSVEGKHEESDLDHVRDETCDTLRKAATNRSIPFGVFKVTGLARFEILEKVNAALQLSEQEIAEWQRVRARVDAICALAYEFNLRVFIDAEDSWIQNAIDQLADEMMEKYNGHRAIVFNTIQLYRHDRLDFLKSSFEKAQSRNYHLGVKLVRGAYMEKERARAAEKGYADPIQPDKTSSDRDFDMALRWCMDHLDRLSLCCGSHNEASNLLLAQMVDEYGLQRNDERIWFAQLYGMSDHISYNLAHAGYNVAKYVPYGPIKDVIPYLIRRAKENTSVKGQTGRELSLIEKEMKRRKEEKS
jgi:proline dehydrogenase